MGGPLRPATRRGCPMPSPRVQGSRVKGTELRVQGSTRRHSRVWGVGCKVQHRGLGVWGVRYSMEGWVCGI